MSPVAPPVLGVPTRPAAPRPVVADPVHPVGVSRAPVAIVGMAGTFAGSRDINEYWSNILHEVDCITDVPPSHWAVEDYYDPDPTAPDKTYCKRGGFLPEQNFNPLEFGLPPNILELTDVAQLLSLVVASRALADAGFGTSNPHAARTGVVLGVSALALSGALSARLQYPIWQRVLRSRGVPEREIDPIVETIKRAYVQWREDAFPGYLSNVVAGRIANRLNLYGINCSIDAACASSLASLQLAVHELRSHNCDLMLAGGVDTNNTPMGFVSFSKTPAFTAHNQMRPFDAASDGMLIGEGVGVLVLRRLEDAERDGQRVYAVIRGVGASSDGRFSSIYAPRREGQELAIRRAYAEAAVPPSSIGLLEAHGTGTPTGDQTELAALQAVFGSETGAKIALGSVKSQIGHTKVAAGVASLIKVALALHEKVLPPTINVVAPHAAVQEPFYLNTRLRPWFSTAPRRAGVSSFGFGGTNFHVVLEEHRPAKTEGPRAHPTPFAIFLHADGFDALAETCVRVVAELRSDTGPRRFRELVETSKREKIPHDAARVGFLAATREYTLERLEAAIAALSGASEPLPTGLHLRDRAMDGRLVVLFPGQGSQSVDMGAALCANFPPFHDAFARMDAVRAQHGRPSISQLVYPPPDFATHEREAQVHTLRTTSHAQAAIGAFNLGLFEILTRCGCAPDFVAGHSLGELTALYASGVLTEGDYLSLLVARGEAMAAPPPAGVDPGTLLAIGGDTTMLEVFLQDRPGITIANRNAPSQLVVAGSCDDLAALKVELSALGVSAIPLPVAGAFHSERVAHAQAPFAHALDNVPLGVPRIPVWSNTTAAPYPSSPDAAAEVRRLLAQQLLRPVDFQREIEAIYEAGGRVFVECGPGRVLTGLVGKILGERPHLVVALNRTRVDDDDRSLRDGYVRLRVAGVELSDLDPWQALPDGSEPRRGPVVRLSGSPYKSEGTRLVFEEALTRAPEVMMTDNEARSPLERAAPAPRDTTGEAHLRYLQHLAEGSARCFELTQQLFTLATNPACPPAAFAAFERAIGNFHTLQLTAHHVHAQFLGQALAPSVTPPEGAATLEGAPVVTSAPAPRINQPSPPVSVEVPTPGPTPTPAPLHNGVSSSRAAPLPNPTGVRPTEAHPTPTPPPAQPAAPPASSAPQPASPPARTTAPRPASPPAAASRPVTGAPEIATILMGVISEKTGYPLDTLDVGMDVDADLGIDSLKRVEIMAALEGRLFRSLSGIDFSAFATRRTISEIAQYLAEVG